MPLVPILIVLDSLATPSLPSVMFSFPDVMLKPASSPTAILNFPLVTFASEPSPIAVLKLPDLFRKSD